MKKAIAMRCTQEQFDAIKSKLENVKVHSMSSFSVDAYLVNNAFGKLVEVINFSKFSLQYNNREVHETWNEKVFLEACGIEVKPTLEEVYKYFENAKTIRVGNVEFERKGDIYFSSGSFYQTENRYCMWHPINGYSKITEFKKPIRTNKLTELEKRVSLLENKVDLKKIADMPKNPIKMNFGIDFGKPDSHNDILSPKADIRISDKLKDDLKNGKIVMGYETGNDYHEKSKPFDFQKLFSDDALWLYRTFGVPPEILKPKFATYESIDAFQKAFIIDDQEYYKVINGGNGAHGADCKIVQIVKLNSKPEKYNGSLFNNAKIYVKTISGEYWGLSEGFKIEKATSDEILHAKNKVFQKAFDSIDTNKKDEVNQLKCRIEELEAELKHILAGGKSNLEKTIQELKNENQILKGMVKDLNLVIEKTVNSMK